MYCSVCGSKLKDGVQFCTNCGSKVEYESAPVAEEIKVSEPIVSTVEVKAEEPIVEVKAEEPAVEIKAEPVLETIVEEPVVETKVEEPVPVVKVEEPVVEIKSEPVPEVKVEEPVVEIKAEPAPEVKVEEPVIEVVNANGPIIENPNQETIKQANIKQEPKKKAKKKKKPWVIVLIVLLILFVVLPILLVVLVILVIIVCSMFGIGGLTLGAILSGPVEKPEVDTSYLQTISQYYGDYHGTSKVSATYNSKELINFLDTQEIYLDEEELHTDLSESEFAISIYSDPFSDASWDMLVDMGDAFGYQSFSNVTFITYEDFEDQFYVLGDMNIDSATDEFYVSVSDYDYDSTFNYMLGVDEDLICEYSMKFYGTADGDEIDGVLKVTFLYDGMSKPYSEDIEIHAEK